MTLSQSILILIRALKQWKCPACGGLGTYTQRWIEREPPTVFEQAAGLKGKPVHNAAREETVPCTKCNGKGLHPIAQEALTKAGVDL